VFPSGASVTLACGSRFFNGETGTAIRAVFRRASPDLAADHRAVCGGTRAIIALRHVFSALLIVIGSFLIYVWLDIN
jgi:hypothetical protein